MHTRSPLAAVRSGIAAGAVGTLAMDLLWFNRYRRGGGEQSFVAWEFSAGLTSWEDAGAPAQMGKRLLEGVFQRKVAPERAGLVNDLMHWFYGLFWSAQYGLVQSRRPPRRPLRSGIAFGFTVWASDYVVLPLAKLYKPIWQYELRTLAEDLSAHLVYGVATSVTFHLLSSR